MATVTNITTYARNHFKGNSDLLSAEELRIAQEVQNYVNSFYPWKWAHASGTDVTVTQSTQEYTLNAADQARIQVITEAWLLSGTTDQFPLLVYDWIPVPTTDTEERPYSVSLLDDGVTIRLYPNPDASYTFSFRYRDLGALITANTESYTAPARFDEAIKLVFLWKFASFIDDAREPKLKEEADLRLEQQKRNEIRRHHLLRE